MIDTFGDNLLEGFEHESPSHEGNHGIVGEIFS